MAIVFIVFLQGVFFCVFIFYQHCYSSCQLQGYCCKREKTRQGDNFLYSSVYSSSFVFNGTCGLSLDIGCHVWPYSFLRKMGQLAWLLQRTTLIFHESLCGYVRVSILTLSLWLDVIELTYSLDLLWVDIMMQKLEFCNTCRSPNPIIVKSWYNTSYIT